MTAENLVEPELTERGFEIMRYAVRLSCDQQIQRLETLRNRLEADFPGESADITAALTTWAEYAKRHG